MTYKGRFVLMGQTLNKDDCVSTDLDQWWINQCSCYGWLPSITLRITLTSNISSNLLYKHWYNRYTFLCIPSQHTWPNNPSNAGSR